MSSEKKMSTQNIITFAVAGVAVLLVLVVLLVKLGVFEKKDDETTLPEMESSVVVASETMENGEMVYYTMLEHYKKPHVSSNYVYPTKEPPSTTEPSTTSPFVDASRAVQVTNEYGNPLLDEFGNPVTTVEHFTVPAGQTVTEEPKSEEVTQASTDNIEQTSVEESETKNISKEEGAASSIVDAINQRRAENKKETLSNSKELRSLANTKSTSMIFPELYGSISLPSRSYTFKTRSSGTYLIDEVMAAADSAILSDDVSEIGVSVIRSKDTYYTTVIFR